MKNTNPLRLLSEHVDNNIISCNKGQFFEYISSIEMTQPLSNDCDVKHHLTIHYDPRLEHDIAKGDLILMLSNVHYHSYYYHSLGGKYLLLFHTKASNKWYHQVINKPSLNSLFILNFHVLPREISMFQIDTFDIGHILLYT